MQHKCTSCGSSTTDAVLDDAIKVGGVRFTGTVPGWRCRACGEAGYDGAALGRFELAAAARLLDAGVHGGDVLRFARKALGFKAVELGELLGVRPETISRWETGERPAEARAAALIGALVHDALAGRDATSRRLRAMQAPLKLPRRIALEPQPDPAPEPDLDLAPL